MKLSKFSFALLALIAISCQKEIEIIPQKPLILPLEIKKQKTKDANKLADSSTANLTPKKNNNKSYPKIISQKEKQPFLIADFFKTISKPAQEFLINSKKDTTLICFENTKIIISANSFISEKTKEEVSGNLKIKVTEYYSLSDIVFANLSTTSNGELIETAGMINISVNSDDENCILKDGKKCFDFFSQKRIQRKYGTFYWHTY